MGRLRRDNCSSFENSFADLVFGIDGVSISLGKKKCEIQSEGKSKIYSWTEFRDS